ncbi:hypothetical protein MKK75_32895 [Methylobacterium sp. J-030]|uniref:hypothetical protein n=1 Tax=Methylobacterium sp. J-030 TaxID=2836627 RepID=UPI001FBC0C33|nr:hypothetical protein [Methylobacterium sp. J-030]MCJ2073531.1 hypothetical protein [Methylobacterium sp. J-030]
MRQTSLFPIIDLKFCESYGNGSGIIAMGSVFITEHATTNLAPSADDAATRFAFSLLRSACLDLAPTLRCIEAEPARALLQAVEHRTADRRGALARTEPDAVARAVDLAVAAGQVQVVLRDAQDR